MSKIPKMFHKNFQESNLVFPPPPPTHSPPPSPPHPLLGWRRCPAGRRQRPQATAAAQRGADSALQLHGGQGVVSGSVIERLYREVRALRIYEGANALQKLIIASRELKNSRDAAGQKQASTEAKNSGIRSHWAKPFVSNFFNSSPLATRPAPVENFSSWSSSNFINKAPNRLCW